MSNRSYQLQNLDDYLFGARTTTGSSGLAAMEEEPAARRAAAQRGHRHQAHLREGLENAGIKDLRRRLRQSLGRDADT